MSVGTFVVNFLSVRRFPNDIPTFSDINLSLDLWWLVWGIFIIAIIERGNLTDINKPWFNIFSLIFELVSAFAGIGLSLGFPGVIIYFTRIIKLFMIRYGIRQDNFSLSGTMKPLSKIVIIVIMCVKLSLTLSWSVVSIQLFNLLGFGGAIEVCLWLSTARSCCLPSWWLMPRHRPTCEMETRRVPMY
jgi:hypothetical protein